MKYLILIFACLGFTACIEDAAPTDTGPAGIIETGYLSCTPAANGCDGALSCTDDQGESACVEADGEVCVGETSCACEGQWVCGDRECADVDGGFECIAPAGPVNDRCLPSDCLADGESGATLCADGSSTGRTCERGNNGVCGWVYSACPDEPVVCAPEACGDEPDVFACPDGGAPSLTCTSSGGGLCEWAIGECANDVVDIEACAPEDCGEPIEGAELCADGSATAPSCRRDDAGECQWVVDACPDALAPDVVLGLGPCEPIEMPNDAYELRTVDLRGDILYADVEYSGGCAEHLFAVCPFDFREAEPVQVTIGLYHDSQGDTCEAIESTLIGIDLTFLKRQYEARYGEESGSIDISVSSPQQSSESIRYSF